MAMLCRAGIMTTRAGVSLGVFRDWRVCLARYWAVHFPFWDLRQAQDRLLSYYSFTSTLPNTAQLPVDARDEETS